MKKNNQRKIFIIIGITCFIFIVFFALPVIIFYVIDNVNTNSSNNIKDDYKLSSLSYKLSKDFDLTTYSYSKYYSYSNDSVYCSINISYDEIDNYNNYDNGNDYLLDNVNIKLKDKYDGPSKLLINNYDWYKLDVISNDNYALYNEYFYATKYANRMYYVKYIITDYNNGDSDINNSVCYNYVDEFFSSLKFD